MLRWLDRRVVMDGVAVTIECRELSRFRSAAGGFAVAVLLCAPFELAQAQTINPGSAPLNAHNNNVPGNANAPGSAAATPAVVPPPGADASKSAAAPAAGAASATTSPPPAGAAAASPQSASLPGAPEEKRGFLNDLSMLVLDRAVRIWWRRPRRGWPADFGRTHFSFIEPRVWWSGRVHQDPAGLLR